MKDLSEHTRIYPDGQYKSGHLSQGNEFDMDQQEKYSVNRLGGQAFIKAHSKVEQLKGVKVPHNPSHLA